MTEETTELRPAAAERRAVAERLAGEEDLRFIRNFHDIFLSIGLFMFSAGLAIATAILVGPMIRDAVNDDARSVLTIVVAAALGNAAIAWLLAEFFARGRRLFLPSIVLFCSFSFFAMIAAAAGYALWKEADPGALVERLDRAQPLDWLSAGSEAGAVIFALTALAGFLFYARMKLPFAMGLSAATLAYAGIAAFIWQAGVKDPSSLAEPLQLAAGLFLFALGVFFDARDPQRESRISDNGFWLHFFAAPLILNSVLGMTVGLDRVLNQQTAAAAITLAVVLAFSLVSLLINRRALLVAGLLYALISVGYLMSQVGLSGAWTAALTLLVMGGAMVLLGGGWHAFRRIVVAPFPKEGLIARIIPPEPPRGQRARDE